LLVAQGAISIEGLGGKGGALVDAVGQPGEAACDAKGGGAQMTVAGSAYPATPGGTPITATLTNTVASY